MKTPAATIAIARCGRLQGTGLFLIHFLGRAVKRFHPIVFLIPIVLGGCGPKPKSSSTQSTRPTTMQFTLSARGPAPADPGGPSPELPVLIHLDIYLLDLPLGAVSRNEDLWKRVDEQAIGAGPASADLLAKNGLRGGIASRADWAYFKEFMDRQPGRMRRQSINGTRAEAAQLEIEKPIDREDLFYFDLANRLQGRTFESCTNGMRMSFQPTPQRSDSVRLVICPSVRSERRRLEFTPLNQDYESPFVEETRLYDVNLRADVSEESFLVLSPAPTLTPDTSIGGRFLQTNEPSERLEQVLLIVPSFLRAGKPITVTETLRSRP